MAIFHSSFPAHLLLLLLFLFSSSSFSAAAPRHLIARRLFLVQEPPLVLIDHKGPLLKGNYSVHLLFYGHFTPAQRAIFTDFISSLSPSSPSLPQPSPSVASWWSIASLYRGGPSRVSLGRVILDERLSRGKSLSDADLLALATRATPHKNSIVAILTAADVLVDGFCMSRCGFHDDVAGGKHGKARFTYMWAGNPAKQCPGTCAWPFAQPPYGPQTPPLGAPNDDVGVDGLLISLATLVAGTVTNPYGDGYYQGLPALPLEAVSACTGIFGPGAYPGYPGTVLTDPTTGASYNAKGVRGREYLLPTMWSPKTKNCTTTPFKPK